MKAVLTESIFRDPFTDKNKSYHFSFYGRSEEGTLNLNSDRFLHDPTEPIGNFDFEIEITIKAIRKTITQTTLQ